MHEVLYCRDCKRQTVAVLDHASGDTICTECALVLNEHFIDETSEWRTFSNDGSGEDRNPSRVGGIVNPLLDNGGDLSTSIMPAARKKQTNANADDGKMMRRPSMLSTGQRPHEVLLAAFRGITDMADRLGLVATITDRAHEVFKKVEENKLCPRGRNKDAIYAACLYIACRNEGKPRTLKEISSVTNGAAKKEIGKLTTLIKNNLGEETGQVMDMGVVHAANYLRRFCSLIGMVNREVRTAEELVQRLEKDFDIRRNPESIAAAVIYMIAQMSDDKKSIKEVSMATGVAVGTIKEAYKALSPHASRLFVTSK